MQKISRISDKHWRWIILAAVLCLYPIYLSGISTNPPGFYVDESCIAYNAYLISTTGTAENGAKYPLFIQCYSGDSAGYAHPTDVYLLSLMYMFTAPSIISARIMAATVVFLSAILLGLTARRVSGRRSVGVIVGLTAMATPWLFEIGRLVLDNFVFIFSVVLFLLFLSKVYIEKVWKFSDSFLIACSLGLITYSYTSGRLLAPLFALGLLLFANNRPSLYAILKTWIVYFVLLIPFIFVYFSKDEVVTKRFKEVTYILPDRSWSEIAVKFVMSYLDDIDPRFLLSGGDPILRHHIGGGEIYFATFALAVIGLIVVVFRFWRDPWWRFIILGLLVSVLPGAITVHRHHALRLLSFPIFLLLFTIPGILWLLGDQSPTTDKGDYVMTSRRPIFRIIGLSTLIVLVLLTAWEMVSFHSKFRSLGPERRVAFDADYPALLAEALAQPARPIYLKDGAAGPAYIDAFWYATIQGVDLSNFHHLAPDEQIPANAVVLSSDMTCVDCNVIAKKSVYLLFRTVPTEGSAPSSKQAKIFGATGEKPDSFMRPRGVAADAAGNFYVADTGNHRVQKFTADGNFILSLGTRGKDIGQLESPNGIAIDNKNNVYVVDAANQMLLRFGPDGKFQDQWKGDDLGFYGPRDVSIAPDGRVYIVDQGRSRIVVFDPTEEVFTSFGSPGKEEGQFMEPMGITIGDDLVFVTESGNRRIQVFDLDGKFVRQWAVDVWDRGIDSYPDCVFDRDNSLLYVTGEQEEDVIAFDVNGKRVRDVQLSGNIKLNKPSSLFLSRANNSKTLFVADISNSKIAIIDLGTTPAKR